jgi:hypothetical protein
MSTHQQTLQIQATPPAHDQALDTFQPEPVRRRGALGVLSRYGIVVVGGLAAVFATAEPAAADCQHSPCCELASCTKCSNGCRFSCGSSGYRVRRYWYCAAGNRIIGCGECQRGTGTCWTGFSQSCSVWWDDAYC